MQITSAALVVSLGLIGSEAASAQPLAPAGSPQTTGTVVQSQPNTTGNDPDLIISRGATGAETVTTNSAAGGNATHPERAVPNGSSSGGGGSQGGG